MDVQKEIDFLLLLDNKVTLLAEKVAVIGPLIEVIAMIKVASRRCSTKPTFIGTPRFREAPRHAELSSVRHAGPFPPFG
jgi:hypothetical protein